MNFGDLSNAGCGHLILNSSGEQSHVQWKKIIKKKTFNTYKSFNIVNTRYVQLENTLFGETRFFIDAGELYIVVKWILSLILKSMMLDDRWRDRCIKMGYKRKVWYS